MVVESPDSGTLKPVDSPAILETGGATIFATPNEDTVIPLGCESIYFLTKKPEFVIVDMGFNHSFVVNTIDDYSIHTLVYDSNTLDLSNIQYGISTIFDVYQMTTEGGGGICVSLDLDGAPVTVEILLFSEVKLFKDVSVYPNPVVSHLEVVTRFNKDEILSYTK